MNPHSYRLKGRDFVHQGKIEIEVNERAVFIRTQGCFFVYTNSDCFLNSLLNSTHLLYLISADSHIHFMSYFCNIKGQTRQARWLLTNLTFYNQISGFFLLLQYVSNQDLIYLVFILNPFLKMTLPPLPEQGCSKVPHRIPLPKHPAFPMPG